jgi:outer membrane protein OmpA-like peptidoglycan-associated protein
MSASMLSPQRGPSNDCLFGEFVDRDTMRFVRDFSHPAALVWEAITTPEEIRRWFWPCVTFEAKAGGRYRFEDEGLAWGGKITTFDPPRRLELDMGLLFELFEENGHCRLVLTLKRSRIGWSVMALSGYMGWLGRLTRLLDGAAQEETEFFCSDIWEAVWPAYERMLRHAVTGGAKAIYRLHFAESDPVLVAEAREHLDTLITVLRERPDLNVAIDGFGADSLTREDSIVLCKARMDAATDYLKERGITPARILTGFTLGNYHPLVPNDTEAGRAFNRRVELRPIY